MVTDFFFWHARHGHFSYLLKLILGEQICWFMFGHELHNYLLYFKVFLLSNMSFQSKEEIPFPACTKEVRIFSSLLEPW